MAYELPDTPQQVGGLNLSAVPGAVAPSVADVPNLGMVNLPGYTQEDRTRATAPEPTGPSTLNRIGMALEAFGSGYRGQEPLYLKLRRQQAVEEQNQLDRKIRSDQLRVQMAHQDWTETSMVMDKLKDDPAAGLKVLQQRAKAGSPASKLMIMSGVGTKDFTEIPHLMPVIQELDPEGYGMVQQAIQTNTVDQLDPLRLRGMKERAIAYRAQRDTAQAEAKEWEHFEKLDPDMKDERHLELYTKRVKREKERQEAILSRTAMSTGTKGDRESAAGLKTPDAITAQTTAQQSAQAPWAKFDPDDTLAKGVFGVLPGQLDGLTTREDVQRAGGSGYRVTLGVPRQQAMLSLRDQYNEKQNILKAQGTAIGQDLAPLNERASEYRKLEPGGILAPATQSESARSASGKGYVNVAKHGDVLKQYEATQNLNKALGDLAPLSKQLFTAHPGLVNIAKQATKLLWDSWSRGGKKNVTPPPDYAGRDAAQPSAVNWDGQQLTIGQAYNLYRDLTVQAMEAYQRGLFQMKGAGTEGDVSRGLSGLPTIGATPEEAGLKFNNVILWSLDSQRSALKTLGFKAEDIDRSLASQLPPPVKDKPTLEAHLQSYAAQVKRLRMDEAVMKEVLTQEGLKWKQRNRK